jgi:type IV pilus assembly protein PilW
MNKIRRPQGGFTLIELMIGMVLGMFIVIALITLLININRNNTELAKSNRLIENGRLALQILASDIEHAGFLGGYVPDFDDLTNTAVPTEVPAAIPDPCLAYSTANWTAAYKVELIGLHTAAYQVPSTPSAPVCSGVVLNPKGNTDVLVIRHAEPCLTSNSLTECGDTTANAHPDVFFQSSRCSTDASKWVLSPASASLNLKKGDCTTQQDVRRFASTLYYVRTYSTTSGDNIPTLMRSKLAATSTDDPTQLPADPLIEGVEGFVVEYGLDNVSDSGASVDFTTAVNWATTTPAYKSPTNRGDGNPDTYVHCTTASPCTVAQLMNVVTVKVWLLMRADAATNGYTDAKTYNLGSVTLGPFNDKYKRHVFSETIRLTNVSGRRETPT